MEAFNTISVTIPLESEFILVPYAFIALYRAHSGALLHPNFDAIVCVFHALVCMPSVPAVTLYCACTGRDARTSANGSSQQKRDGSYSKVARCVSPAGGDECRLGAAGAGL